MSLATADLPEELEAPRAFAVTCQGALKMAEAAIQLKALEIEKLNLQLARYRRMQFGKRSERISRHIAQLELRLEELESSVAEDAAKAEAEAPASPEPPEPRERTKPRRKPLPPHLPRANVVHQPPRRSRELGSPAISLLRGLYSTRGCG
jgi:hypothetical protein